MMNKAIFIVGVLCLVGCSNSSTQTNGGARITQKFVSIAVVGGTDSTTQAHIVSLLKVSSIDSYTEGSAVYGVFVPSQDTARATKILKADAATKKYWIEFPK